MKQKRAFFTPNHLRAHRDYRLRAGDDKPQLSTRARQWGFDYWDGSRSTGYGGYSNDGRWNAFAEQVFKTYEFNDHESICDLGCGKGFLLKALIDKNPKLKVSGLDVSQYAIENADKSVSAFVKHDEVSHWEAPPKSIDYIFAINVLHNLQLPQLFKVLRQIESAKRKDAYVCVESYRSEQEKWNLMRWQLTCECFFTPEEWLWIFEQTGYSGDYEFIYFE